MPSRCSCFESERNTSEIVGIVLHTSEIIFDSSLRKGQWGSIHVTKRRTRRKIERKRNKRAEAGLLPLPLSPCVHYSVAR